MNYAVHSAIRRNNRPNKPCEDFLVCGRDVFVVADGVTQNAEEYHEDMTSSRAAEAARLTAETIASALERAEDPTAAIREAVARAVDITGRYNEAHDGPYPAAAVFVSGAIRADTLHFAYLGDSMIVLLRGGVRIRLSEQQTSHLRLYRGTFTKRELYDTVTNNAGHPLGYGVIDGEERALDFLRASSLKLQAGDRLILASDGIDKYLAFAPIDELSTLPPEALLDRSEAYDKPPYNNYADDKAVIIVDVQ